MRTRISAVKIGDFYGLQTNFGNRLQLADGGTPPANVRLQHFVFDTLNDAQAAAARWNIELASRQPESKKS